MHTQARPSQTATVEKAPAFSNASHRTSGSARIYRDHAHKGVPRLTPYRKGSTASMGSELCGAEVPQLAAEGAEGRALSRDNVNVACRHFSKREIVLQRIKRYTNVRKGRDRQKICSTTRVLNFSNLTQTADALKSPSSQVEPPLTHRARFC